MRRRDFLTAIGLLPFLPQVIVAEPKKWKYTACRQPKPVFPVIRLNEFGSIINEEHLFAGVQWVQNRHTHLFFNCEGTTKTRATYAWLLEKDRREFIDMIWVEGKLAKIRNKFYWGIVKVQQVEQHWMTNTFIERTTQSKTGNKS
jgi:hypothetical protein